MRRSVTALALATALGCTAPRETFVAPPPTSLGPGRILRAAELARVRCLLIAPFENGSDAPLAAEAATGALLSGVDPARARVFPIPDLRALFRDTPLELPQGIPPSLALELAELVGADATIWGSVEGRSQDATGELLVTVRLSLASSHHLLFADTWPVRLAPGDRVETAVRRAVLEGARPMLARLGDPGRKRCFEADRTRTLRRFALAEATEARAPAAAAPRPAPAPAPGPAQPPAAKPAPPPAAAARTVPRTPRQTEWAKRLESGDRFVLEDVAFAGRTSELQRDGGLADLAVALFARPAVTVRLEGFVDASSDRADDAKLSTAMAQAAGQRLVELGVPLQRLSWVGRGGTSPILPNFTARGRAANRRVEVVVVP